MFLTLINTKMDRKVARKLRGTSPSTEDRLQKLEGDLGQCNKRFGDLLKKIQELLADEQGMTKMV